MRESEEYNFKSPFFNEKIALAKKLMINFITLFSNSSYGGIPDGI